MLLLIPLFFVLVFPRVVYTPISADDEDVSPNASSFLLPAGEPVPSTGFPSVPGLSGEASKYGTFRSAHPAIPPSGPTTRAHTPVPSNRQDKVRRPARIVNSLLMMVSFSWTKNLMLLLILRGLKSAGVLNVFLLTYGHRRILVCSSWRYATFSYGLFCHSNIEIVPVCAPLGRWQNCKLPAPMDSGRACAYVRETLSSVDLAISLWLCWAPVPAEWWWRFRAS